MFKRNGKSGFTLLELLIVVIIVSILAAVALPQFGKMTKKAKSSEAQNTIGSIFTAESLYYQENNEKFAADLTNTNLMLDFDSTKFTYTVSGTPPPLVVVASGVTGTTGEGITVTGTLTTIGKRTIATN